jgi:hypothetical protein
MILNQAINLKELRYQMEDMFHPQQTKSTKAHFQDINHLHQIKANLLNNHLKKLNKQ